MIIIWLDLIHALHQLGPDHSDLLGGLIHVILKQYFTGYLALQYVKSDSLHFLYIVQ